MNSFFKNSRKLKILNRAIYFTGLVTLYQFFKSRSEQFQSIFNKRKSLDKLKEKYSDGWVVITGSTSGLGLSFAYEFSKLGFKTMLISRDESKLSKLSHELRRDFKTKSNFIVFDYSDCSDEKNIKTLKRKINSVIGDDKISVIVNNVGMQSKNDLQFESLKENELINYVNVNCLSQLVMYNIFLTKMKNQNSKSLIIDVSSSSADIDCLPINAAYQSTKTFNKKFTESIRLQNEVEAKYQQKENMVDIVSFKPGMFVSNLSERHHTKQFISDWAENCVLNCLFDVASGQKDTYGTFKHKIMFFILNLTPKCFRQDTVAAKLWEDANSVKK